MSNTGRVLLGVCLGAALTLLADSLLHYGGRPPATESEVKPSPARLVRQSISGPAHVPTIARAPARQETSAKTAGPAQPDLKATEFAMGEGSLQRDEGLRSAPLSVLLSSLSVRCNFDPGAGACWSAGNVHTHGVSYSGGEIVYRSVDIGDGTAQMIGMPDATGSTSGELDVRVTAINAGLHFAGFTPAGSLLVTSVYMPRWITQDGI